MHARNARPEDKDVAAQLQGAFETLRVMQHERAEKMSTCFRSTLPMPSEEDSEVVKKALEILAKYETLPPTTSQPPRIPLAPNHDPKPAGHRVGGFHGLILHPR